MARYKGEGVDKGGLAFKDIGGDVFSVQPYEYGDHVTLATWSADVLDETYRSVFLTPKQARRIADVLFDQSMEIEDAQDTIALEDTF